MPKADLMQSAVGTPRVEDVGVLTGLSLEQEMKQHQRFDRAFG
jgi:hypothetical protein